MSINFQQQARQIRPDAHGADPDDGHGQTAGGKTDQVCRKIAKHQAGKGVDFIAGKMFGGKKDEDKGLLDKMGDTKNKVDNLSKGKFDDEGQNKKNRPPWKARRR